MGKKCQPQRVTRVALSTGELAVLPTESAEDLQTLIDELEEQNEPKTPHEQFLVDSMVRALWHLQRYQRLESEALDRMLENEYGPVSADRRLINRLEDSGNIFDKLQRLAGAAERSYNKAVRELTQHRAAAQKAEKQNKAKSADDWLKAELAKLENEPIDDEYIRTGIIRPRNTVRQPTVAGDDLPASLEEDPPSAE